MAGRIIITADDFGACEFVDNGIIRAIDGGNVNTVSAFVSHVRSEQSITRLVQKKINQATNHFNIGLHFSITSGYTLQSGMNTLTKELKDGKFYFKTANYYNFRNVNPDDLRNEIIAQLAQLDVWLGNDIKIDHVTVHHGITYLDSVFFTTFINTVVSYKGPNGKYNGRPIPIRSPQSWYTSRDVRNCCYDPDSNEKILFPGVGTVGLELGYWRKILQNTGGKLIAKKAESDSIGLRSTEYLVDVIYNQACSNGIECVLNEVVNKNLVVEFMLHLGFLDDGENMEERDFMNSVTTVHGVDKDYFYKRMMEELWTIEDAMQLGQRIRELNIIPISYSDL